MVRPGCNRLVGRVEVDETYVGGVEEGVRGREMVGKALVAVAAEEDGRGMGRIRLRRIVDASAASLEAFVEEAIQPGSLVHTDGWEGYAGLENKGYRHEVTVLRGKRQSASKLLPRVPSCRLSAKALAVGDPPGGCQSRVFGLLPGRVHVPASTGGPHGRAANLFYRLLQQAVAADPAPYKTMVEATRAGTPTPKM